MIICDENSIIDPVHVPPVFFSWLFQMDKGPKDTRTPGFHMMVSNVLVTRVVLGVACRVVLWVLVRREGFSEDCPDGFAPIGHGDNLCVVPFRNAPQCGWHQKIQHPSVLEARFASGKGEPIWPEFVVLVMPKKHNLVPPAW